MNSAFKVANESSLAYAEFMQSIVKKNQFRRQNTQMKKGETKKDQQD